MDDTARIAGGRGLAAWQPLASAGPRVQRPSLAWLVWLGVAALLACLALSWHQPVLDIHGFRQAQTAITAYWLQRGGDWLIYPTPVFGAPWSVPFEFPLFQWAMAGLSSWLPLSLDQSGRVVSVACLLACLWPLRQLLRDLGGDRDLRDLACGFLLLSPLYLFWGRSVMIESMALLLALSYLAAMQRFLHTRSWAWVLAAAVLATLAALVKVTTLFGFALLAAVLLLVAMSQCLRRPGGLRDALRVAAAGAGPILLALGTLHAWLQAGDAVKATSPLTADLVASGLQEWLYGPPELRLSVEFWRELVLRIVPDTLGHAWLLALPLAALAVRARRGAGGVLGVLVLLFLAPVLVFSNLHFRHDYYPVAVAIFLLVALAVSLHGASLAGPAWLRPLLALACVAGMALHFGSNYWPAMRKDPSEFSTLRITQWLQANTRPDDVIVVRGRRWSPVIAYYAQRRAIMIRPRTDISALTPSLLAIPGQARPARVGAVLDCGERDGKLAPVIAWLGPGATREERFGCQVYRPAPD